MKHKLKSHILHDFIYMKCPEQVRDGNDINGGGRVLGGIRFLYGMIICSINKQKILKTTEL